ncbi:hypothetical protein ACJRW5_23750 [Pseudomonas sp. SH1-B]
MGWDSRDTAALNAATAAGIKCFAIGVVGDDGRQVMLNKIECPGQPGSGSPEKLLADAIEGVTRLSAGGDSLWIEVAGNEIPQYVADAVSALRGFGCRMIVTLGNKSTRGNGGLLDSSFCEAVEAANQGGAIWHPLDNTFVFAA